ncbi:MAG TPA: single-stranded DNA-binding protein [Phycisphaerae bacterium]|nr:single-stranded DNA-binding protein [Phycisphaerae bacterium]
MANFNKVLLMGNLTRDPQLSYLPSQTPVCEIGLAVNRRWSGQDGQPREEVTFVDCVAYGRQAETISKYLRKGRPVFLEGRLKLDQWEAQDGSKRSKMRVVIENFQFIDSRGAGSGGETEPAAAGEQDHPVRSAPRAAGRPAGSKPAAGAASSEHAAPTDADAPPPGEEEIPF